MGWKRDLKTTTELEETISLALVVAISFTAGTKDPTFFFSLIFEWSVGQGREDLWLSLPLSLFTKKNKK